jgi:flagellar protein FlaJ
MERRTHQRIATALAVLAALAGLASAAVPREVAASLLATGGFAALAVGLHVVRPRQDPEAAEASSTPANLLGLGTALAMVSLGLLLVAAGAARFGHVRYLGDVPLLLSENFQLVTGPLTALLAGSVLMASRDRLALASQPSPDRRWLTASLLTLGLLVTLVIALPGTLGEPWQAPYVLGLAALVAWQDAIHLAGLPRLTQVGSWLERGETRHSRLIVEGLARAGNGAVLLAGLGGLVFLVLGYPSYGVLTLVVATVLLVVTTHSAVSLTKAIPAALSDDIADADRHKSRLRILSTAPLATGLVAGLLTVAAVISVTTAGALSGTLDLLRPILGLGVALLAGVNLARAGMPSFEEHSAARRAVSATVLSVLAVCAFFSLLLQLGIMSGPITEQNLGLVFYYGGLLSAAVFVHTRGLFPVPGLDLGDEEDHETRTDHGDALQRRVVGLYALAGAFLIGSLALVGAYATGRLDGVIPETPEGRNAAFLGLVAVGLLIVLGLLVAFMYSRRLETPPEEQELEFEKSYTREEVVRLTVLGVSGTLATVLGFLGIMVFAGQLESIGSLTLEKRYATDFFVAAILIGIGPAGYIRNRENKRIKAIDQRLPEFLRDLAESQRTGMTLTQAVITASEGNYGALTPEIEKMAAQIEWGVSFDEALKSFAKRVDTPLVQRTVSLVIEASNAGGNVKDVLDAAAEDAREIQMIHSERRSGMQIYVMIIYIAFAVFLGVIGVLNVKFMPEVAKAVSGAEGVSVGSVTFEEFDIQTFQTIFFHAAIIQGLGGGFVAGSMQEGKPVAGLKHAFAMTIIAYITFRLFLGG